MHLQLAFRLLNKYYDFFNLGRGGVLQLSLYYLHITDGDCQVFLLCSLYIIRIIAVTDLNISSTVSKHASRDFLNASCKLITCKIFVKL